MLTMADLVTLTMVKRSIFVVRVAWPAPVFFSNPLGATNGGKWWVVARSGLHITVGNLNDGANVGWPREEGLR